MEIEMQCSEIQMQIRDVPPTGLVRDEAHLPVLHHYAECATCRPFGLAAIRRTRISCEDAIATCLRGKNLLFDAMHCRTLHDVIAHEHVYGTHARVADGRMVSPINSPVITGCTNPVCWGVQGIWSNAPISSSYDGDDEKMNGAVWTIDMATRSGWNVEMLWQSVVARWHDLAQQLVHATSFEMQEIVLEQDGIKDAFAKYGRSIPA
jgi:hypothetical protein